MRQAIGMIEFTSIARGIYTVDQMVKIAHVEIVTATTTCPGKYIVLVTGDISAVESSIEVGEQEAGEYIVDSIIIPNVTPAIFSAIVGAAMPDYIEAVGIIESFSLSTMVIFAFGSKMIDSRPELRNTPDPRTSIDPGIVSVVRNRQFANASSQINRNRELELNVTA